MSKILVFDGETGQQIERDATPDEQAEIDQREAEASSADTIKINLKAQIAQLRWEKETAGITLNGMPIATDRESQALLTGAFCRALQDPAITINWKGANGEFIQLGKDDINTISAAVGKYVEDCFNAEMLHNQTVDALTSPADLFAYNMHEGWPSNAITLPNTP